METRTEKITYTLFSFALNFWFIFYFFWLQPPFLARLEHLPEQKDVLLGCFLVLMMGVEVIGTWLKIPSIIARFNNIPERSGMGMFITMITMLGHMGLVTALLSFHTIGAFGVNFREDPPLLPGLLAFIFFVAMLVKEGILLGLVMDLSAKILTFENTMLPIWFTRFYQRHGLLSQLLAEVLLAVFSAVAYTATWETIAADAPFTATTFGGRLWEYLGAIILFCMIFPATHPVMTAELSLPKHPWQARVRPVANFLFTMLLAILSIRRA